MPLQRLLLRLVDAETDSQEEPSGGAVGEGGGEESGEGRASTRLNLNAKQCTTSFILLRGESKIL